MKSIVFCDMDMRFLPPYLALMKTLKELGEDPVFVGTDWWENRKLLDSVGVKHCLVKIPDFSISFRQHPVKRLLQRVFPRRRLQKARDCYWRAIKDAGGDEKDVVLWTLNTCSMIALGDWCLEYGRRHVHFCYELEDDLRNHSRFFDVEKFLDQSTFVHCEQNRAWIMFALYGLRHLPFVIPNRPYLNPAEIQCDPPCEVRQIVDAWRGKFVFLYQGILGSDRIGIQNVLECLCEAFPDDIIAVQSHVQNLDISKLLKFSNFSIVSALKAPHHLEVTKRASVGIAFYVSNREKCSPLNAVYCAPNKIYEYTAFGIPTLGNDVPGLQYSVAAANAGVCFSGNDKKSIVAAATKLKENYDAYRANAFKFFASVDLPNRVKEVLTFARA